MKLKFSFNLINVLKIIAFCLFAASIASIPIFSFNPKLYLLTWVIVGLMLADMGLYMLLKRTFNIDVVVLSLVAFSFSALISSALNGFHGFNFTPILLPIATSIIYLFSKSSSSSKTMLMSAFSGICVFLLAFVIFYRNNILHLDFHERLGGVFGDENDIAILLGFGFTYSFYLGLNSKKVIYIIVFSLLSLLFAFCGLLTGSKIYLLILFFGSITTIFLRFGKRKWWISCLIIFGIITIGIILLTLPVFSALKNRLLMFFNTFFSESDSSMRADYSSIFRLYMFQDGIEMFFRKPLFGFGIWGFATYGGLNNGWSHNHFSEGLCNFGLIGFTLFHVPFISSLYHFFKTDNKKEVGGAFTLLVFFLVSMISLSFFTQKIYAFVSAPVFSSFVHKNIFSFSLFSKKERSSL